MESKQMTLRSQTVQCPHCGEYYSVTYKYCPFCDVGQKAEERKKAARKQRTASLFAGILGGKEEAGADVPIPDTSGEPRRRYDSDGPDRTQKHRAAPAAAVDMPPRSEGFRRKKSSEMTPEEREAYRAERAARAEARKRARDAAARQSVLLETGELLETPVASGVSPSEVPMPEDFLSPAPADLTGSADADSMDASPVDLTSEPTDLLLDSSETGEAVSGTAAESGDDWSFLKDLPVGAADGETAAPEIPPLPEMEDAADVQIEEILPETSVLIPPASSISTDSELDALLNEIRGILDGTAPTADASSEQPASEAAQESPAEPGPVSEEEDAQPELSPAEKAPAADASAEPEDSTAVPAADPAQAPSEEASAEASLESPAEPETAAEGDAKPEDAPEEETAETAAAQAKAFEEATLLWSSQDTSAVEAAALDGTTPAAAAAAQAQAERRRARSEARKKQKQRIPILPIVAAIIVVAAVAVLVNKGIAPAIQNDNTVQADTAETLTLDRTVLTLTYEGATETLIPIFSPEGSTAQIKWTCSNWSAVFVHEGGILTAMAPGTATVVATMANGESAECIVTCQWDPDNPTAGAADSDAVSPDPVKVGLNTTDLTLDSQGKTYQLLLEGIDGAARWSSSKTSVASVSGDGTVTAVGKGAATVTAELDGQRYNCEVRCIW